MLSECEAIFRKWAEEERGGVENELLDSYILSEGDYLLVHRDGKIDHVAVSKATDKKAEAKIQISTSDEELIDKIKFFDFYSKIININKRISTIGADKKIQSNNYLSFFVKWSSILATTEKEKLTHALIDAYFNALKNPEDPEKGYKGEDHKVYQMIVSSLPGVDMEKLETNREWIKEHIFKLDELGIDFNKKLYLKIFFEANDDTYVTENNRYVMTKIFGKNEENVFAGNQILGIPNDNITLNDKKVFLKNKANKVEPPYMLSIEDAVRQHDFFLFLTNATNGGKTCLYFNTDEDADPSELIEFSNNGLPSHDKFTGHFLKIRNKNGLAEIVYHDIIVNYREKLERQFDYKNILGTSEFDDKQLYKVYGTRTEILNLINDVLFSKYLKNNFFTNAGDISVSGNLKDNILLYREPIRLWIYNNVELGVQNVLHKLSMSRIFDCIQNGYFLKAREQFNLMCAFDTYFGGINMEDRYGNVRDKLREKINNDGEFKIDDDVEYYYAIGQLTNYFISLSKASSKKHSDANSILRLSSDQKIRTRLRQLYEKYNYRLNFYGMRFNRLYSMILNYKMDSKKKISREDMLAGYLDKNLMYEPAKK